MQINFGSSLKKNKASERSLISKITKKIERLLPHDVEDDMQIMVTEIQCFDPDCVPIETLVILLGANARWTQKILKPMIEVTDEDIAELQIPTCWVDYAETRQRHNESAGSDVKDDFSEKQRALEVNEQSVDSQRSKEDDKKGPDTVDWVNSILHEIRSRAATTPPDIYKNEINSIMRAISEIQNDLSNVPTQHTSERVTIVKMKESPVTHVLMRSTQNTEKATSGPSHSLDTSRGSIENTSNIRGLSATTTNVPAVRARKVEKMKTVVSVEDTGPAGRHKKGVRQRGKSVYALILHAYIKFLCRVSMLRP